MKKQVWTVRIINPNQDVRSYTQLHGFWVEQLRYAGIVRVLAEFVNRSVLELRPPLGEANSNVWAQQQAERMRSFGINAAAAPEWPAGQPFPALQEEPK